MWLMVIFSHMMGVDSARENVEGMRGREVLIGGDNKKPKDKTDRRSVRSGVERTQRYINKVLNVTLIEII